MGKPGVNARAIYYEAERRISLWFSSWEIRDEIYHDRGEDQPLSQETLI